MCPSRSTEGTMAHPALNEQTVVVTGASSGIGRETARRLGSAGARVVLAARNEEALNAAAREVADAGGECHPVITDVSEWEHVDRLSREAVDRFGSIDTWINNAGISLYADLANTSPEEMKRIIDVLLLGEMYGTKAAFEHMRSRGRGVIINVSSVLARRSVPLQASYCAAKHGITGFTEAVRLELKRDYPGIEIVEVLPSSINTPLFSHARSRLGKKPMPIPPIYEPSVVAEALLHACVHPTGEIVVGGAGKMLVELEGISAGLVDRLLLFRDSGVKQQQTDMADDGVDNLFSPMPGPGSTTGQWSEQAKRSSGYTDLLEIHPARKNTLKLASIVGFGGTALFLTRRRSR